MSHDIGVLQSRHQVDISARLPAVYLDDKEALRFYVKLLAWRDELRPGGAKSCQRQNARTGAGRPITSTHRLILYARSKFES